MEFKVGDRVRIKIGAVDMDLLHADGMRCLEGRLGTIIGIAPGASGCSVKADGDEWSWWWRACALEPVTGEAAPNPTWRIIIEGDGNTSRAKYIEGKKIVKEASAKRYHKDKHDPAMAARALIGKMFPDTASVEPEPLKYYTGRVVCVERPAGVSLTVGKIYVIKNGEMGCDEKYMKISRVTSVENLNKRCREGVKFIEVKE